MADTAVRGERPDVPRCAKDVAFETVDRARDAHLKAKALLDSLDGPGELFEAVTALERATWWAWCDSVELMLAVSR